MQQYLIDSEGIVFRDKKDGRYKWMDATGRGELLTELHS